MSMFCNQCQESAHNTGCTIKGVCGKTEDTAGIQDLVVYVCQGLAYVNIEARKQGVNTLPESRKIAQSLFATITNANFDNSLLIKQIKEVIELRNSLHSKLNTPLKHHTVRWNGTTDIEFVAKAALVSVQTYDADIDIRSLKQYVLYGLKGMAAYAEHAANLGQEDGDIYDCNENRRIWCKSNVIIRCSKYKHLWQSRNNQGKYWCRKKTRHLGKRT